MKKIAVLAVAVAMASLSQASELWWTVSEEAAVDTVAVGTWDTAKLFANTTGYNYEGTLVGSASYTAISELDLVRTDISDYASSAYSFYVELWNSTDLVGKSYVTLSPQQGAVEYTTLQSEDAVFNGNVLSPNNASAYSFSSFTTSDVIPEPTSGLMVLLGMMALGLKRKRV